MPNSVINFLIIVFGCLCIFIDNSFTLIGNSTSSSLSALSTTGSAAGGSLTGSTTASTTGASLTFSFLTGSSGSFFSFTTFSFFSFFSFTTFSFLGAFFAAGFLGFLTGFSFLALEAKAFLILSTASSSSALIWFFALIFRPFNLDKTSLLDMFSSLANSCIRIIFLV